MATQSRDDICLLLQLDNERTITVNVWEDVCSLWISGPGKRDWYDNQFQQLYTTATRHVTPGQEPGGGGGGAIYTSHTSRDTRSRTGGGGGLYTSATHVT